MGKDLNVIFHTGTIRSLVMAVPLILVIAVPVAASVVISLFSAGSSAAPPEKLRSFLGIQETGYSQFWVKAFTTLLCPLLYLCVPIICSVAAATSAFVREKEEGTLDSLSLSSMQPRSIFSAKVTLCTLLSVVVSLISFVLFTITISIIDVLIGAPYFLSLEWMVLVLFLAPALSLFSVVFVTLILPRVGSVAESLQTMGYLILPFLFLYLAQYTGAFRVGALFLLLLAAMLMVAAIVLFNRTSRNFGPNA